MKPLKRNSPLWGPPSDGSNNPGDVCRQQPDVRIYPRPILPLLFALSAGILLGGRCPGHAFPVWGGALLGLSLIIHALCRGAERRFGPLLLFLAFGYLSIQPWLAPSLPPRHVSRFAGGEVRRIIGRVENHPKEDKGRIKFVLEAETLFQGDERIEVSGRVRVTSPADPSQITAGDRIQFSGRLRRPRNFHNPGGFDYERYMALKGIRATVYARKGTLVRLASALPEDQSLTGVLADARSEVAGFFQRIQKDESADLLKALVVGDRTGIDPDTRQAFNRAGAAHLLAMSGLHVGIVATASFGLFAWALGWSRALLWRAWTRKGAALLTFLPVVGYGLLAGMSPSTQRAVIMVSLFLLALLVSRERDAMNILGAAALGILIYHPPALFSISFQLSFAAVAAILYGLSRIQSPETIYTDGFRPRLLMFVKVSLLAILGTLPLVMYYFNQISFIGVLTNLVFIPLIGFIIVPTGLLTAALMPLSDLLATVFAHIAIFLMDVALHLIRVFAALPIAAAKTVAPSLFEIAIYYLLGIALLNWIWGEGKRRKVAAIACGALVLAGLADAAYWANRRFGQDDLNVTILDVGQGSAALIEMPGGRCLLVDGGGFYDNDIFDVGKYLVAPYLWRNKIRTVDTLVLTHPNADHLNGLIYVADHFHVKDLWTNGERADTTGYRCLMETCQRKTIQAFSYRNLRQHIDPKEPQIDILYPPVGFMEKRPVDAWRTDENNNSLVLKITQGDVSFLFPGDIGEASEKELVELAGDRLASTVLVAPHHGSRTSSSRAFLQTVNPEVIVISAGWKNRFHFPHPSVMKRYKEIGARIYRTDLDGAIRMETDGRNLAVAPTLAGAKQAVIVDGR